MSKTLGSLAIATLASLCAQDLLASMEMPTVKDKDGKTYFCANAKCASYSDCAGAGNATCGSLNKCANTEQKYLSGWISAKTKETCEKDGLGKWIVFKPEYTLKGGNVAPLRPKADKASPKK